MTDLAQLTAALRWQIEAGADEAIGDTPRDWSVWTPVSRPAAPSPAPPPARSPAPVSPSRPAQAGEGAVPLGLVAAQAEARALADQARTLDELRAALAAFEGCSLKQTATQLVFADGNPEARIMILGEAPGEEEDRQGKPFVGPAGRLLDRMLAAIGLDRTRVYISNIVPWRPPGNRTPHAHERAVCLPFAQRHVALVDPAVLILLGNTAAQAMLDRTEGVSRLRGRWIPCRVPGVAPGSAKEFPALTMYHPAYLLRTPLQKRAAWQDLLVLREKLAADSR